MSATLTKNDIEDAVRRIKGMAGGDLESTGPGTGRGKWKPPARRHAETTHFPRRTGRRPGIAAGSEASFPWEGGRGARFQKFVRGIRSRSAISARCIVAGMQSRRRAGSRGWQEERDSGGAASRHGPALVAGDRGEGARHRVAHRLAEEASEAVGVSVATTHDHRLRDADFGARYGAAMDTAFHQVLSKAFERSMADEEPSDRLIEVLLKFRWPEPLNGFLAFTAEGGSAATAPAGLDPRIIARMEPGDRAALIGLLGRYLTVEVEAKADGALVPDAATTMLRDLMAAETLVENLAVTAPVAVAEAGGAQALVAERGRRTGAWFWSVAPLPDAVWEKMADEHQAPRRANVGDE